MSVSEVQPPLLRVHWLTVVLLGCFSVGVIAHVTRRAPPVLSPGPGPDPDLVLSPAPRTEDGGTPTPAHALVPGVDPDPGPAPAPIPQTRIGTGGVATCECTHLFTCSSFGAC